MKKTGLPLAYPNIPQLSRAAAFPPDTRFPRRGTGGGKPRAAARTYANEKARTHRAGLFHSSGWLAPALRRSMYIIPQPRRRCQALPLYPRCGVAAGVPSRAAPPPGGGREGASLAPQRMAFPFCCGFLGGSLAQDAQRRGADEPPRCLFPHAAGVGVSSRSPVSRVRRAAPRLLLAAVHRAVLHLGRRCSLWQSSTT